MIKIELQGFAEVRGKLDTLARELQPRVLQPALNKIAQKARAEINRAIVEDFNVKADEVRNAIDLRSAAGGNLTAVLTIFGSRSKRGRSMNMMRFLAAVQAAGRAIKTRGAKLKRGDLAKLQGQLGFLIKKGGGMKKIAGAFIGNKGRTIFIRKGDARLPIEPVQVIGFSQMFKSKRIERRVMAKIAADIPVEIDRAIKMILDRAGR